MASLKTGLSPPKFEIAVKRGGSILVLGFYGTYGNGSSRLADEVATARGSSSGLNPIHSTEARATRWVGVGAEIYQEGRIGGRPKPD